MLAERALGAASTAPVYVILSDGRKGNPGSQESSPAQYRIEQLPSGFTTGELASQLSQSASEAGSHLRMLVRLPRALTLASASLRGMVAFAPS